jgi:repressor LexA
MVELTKQQRRVYVYLKRQWQKRNGQPNLSEVAKGLGMHYVSLQQHLKAIEAKGYLSFKSVGKGKPPIVQFYDEGVPVLGDIAAGGLHETESYHGGYLRLKGDGKRFGLRVRGDSMADLIQHDDIVVLEKREPRDSEICAVRVDGGEVTLKYLDRYLNHRNKALLRPHNPNYSPVEIELSRVQVDGVFESLLRGGIIGELLEEPVMN